MRKSLLLALCLLLSFGSFAQTAASYSFSYSSGTYTALTGGTAVSILADDITVTSIPLNFTFRFCGTNYTTVSVTSNGWLSFANSSSTDYTNTPADLVNMAPCVMALWDDLSGAASGPSASYLTTGTSPNRVFTMEWSGWRWNYSNSSANSISFQVKLYEGSNVVRCTYTPGTTTPSNASATIGIANSTADWQTLNGSSTTPTSSSTTFTDNISTSPAAGQIYEWTPPPPCTGTPTAGFARAVPNPVCPTVPFTLIDTGYTNASNLSIQWQSSPASTATWTNITGATTPTYTVAAGITTATDYRVIITCITTSNSATSNTVSVTVNSPLVCYCNSAATSNVDDDIGQITLGTFANPATAPTPILNNSSATGTYTDYTALGPINLFINTPTPFTATQIEFGSGFYTCFLKVFIDLNHDGSFTGTGEQVFAQGGPSVSTAPTPHFSGSITVPTFPPTLTGLTRMRVTLQEFGSNASVTPCNSYTWGETEDYMVNILPQTPPQPVLVSATSPVCRFSTITVVVRDSITGYPGRTYSLSGPFAGSPITGNTTGIFTIPNADCSYSGTYSATVTSGAFTSLPTSVPVTVYCTPTISISNITSPTSCTSTNGSFQIDGLTPNTTYTLFYRKNNVNVTLPPTITANAGGSYVLGSLAAAAYDSIRVRTAAPQNCYSNTIVATQTVSAPNPPATPTVSYQTPLCNNGILNLSVTNPITVGSPVYNWIGPNGFTATGTTATRANMTSANNGNYDVTVTVNGCVSAAGRAVVTVSPPDAAPNTSTSNITYCQYSNAVPLTASGVNLLWYYTLNPTEVGSASITPVTTAVAFPPTSPALIYYVTQTGTCESPRTPVYVIVKPRPLPPAIPSATIQYCQYETVGPISVTGTAVRWYATLTGGLGSVNPPTPVTLVPGTFFFYATQTVNGCESERLIITVIVKPKPEPPGVTSPLNLCQGDPITPLTAVGQNLLWYTIPSGGVGVPVAPLINTGYEDSFFYYVTQTVNGCESDRALLAAYVRYKPNGIITANSQWVCQDESLTFNYYGNGRPDAQYVWFAPLSAEFLSGQGTPGPVVIHFDTAGTSVVQLTINNKGCISNLIAAPITVRPLPKLSFINRQDVCEDELLTISLNGMTPDISGYHWEFGSDAAILEYGETTTGGPFGIRYPDAGHYQVSATATLHMCTSKPIYQEVYVHARPDASITSTPSPIDICASDTLFLSVRRVEEGATYTWTPNAYFQGKHDTLNNQVFAVVSQSSEVKVHVKTAYGCEADDSVKVTTKPCCGVYFPNAFAPGGNVDKNRLFRPITNGVHKINTFRVVNRWGQIVYESKVERNGWDGTLNGTPQDMGTYFYYISYKCEGKDMEDHGEVLLLR